MGGGGDLLDFDLMGGSTPVTQNTPVNQLPTGNVRPVLDTMDLMSDFPPVKITPAISVSVTPLHTQDTNTGFGGFTDLMDLGMGGHSISQQSPAQMKSQPAPPQDDLFTSMMDFTTASPTNSIHQTPKSQPMTIAPQPVVNDDFEFGDFHAPVAAKTTVVAIQDNVLTCNFVCTKESNPAVTTIDVTFDNQTFDQITSIDLKVSPAKNVILNSFNPLGINQIAAGAKGVNTHKITVTNNMHGDKGLAFKVQLTYSVNGSSQTKEAIVSGFMSNY